jgi:mono/diheme cytochrome c family protein
MGSQRILLQGILLETARHRSFGVKLNLNSIAIVSLAVLIAIPGIAQSSGADTFKSKCAPCHGVDGLAATPAGKALKAASFKDPAIVKTPDAQLIAIIKSGKNKMPSFAGKLSDDQIRAALAYIRTLQR